MATAPTAPVPIKERVTSRSLVSSATLGITNIVEMVTDFAGKTDVWGEENYALLGASLGFLAIGYIRDIAMAFIQARAEAAGVSFDDVKQQAQEIDEVARPIVQSVESAIHGLPRAEPDIPPTLTPAQVHARNAAAAAEARAAAAPTRDQAIAQAIAEGDD